MISGRRLKYRAGLQLLIFLLLQMTFILPPLLEGINSPSVAVCHGDHDECGCAPERIAAGNCCCAVSSLPPCCQKEQGEDEMSGELEIAVLPCGIDDPVTAAAADAFLVKSSPILFLEYAELDYRSASLRWLLSHLIPPDIPPPQPFLCI